ncbi:hypothetical protein IWQ62_003837 [Dispira parvispora]|uniref:ubiquitinyl hydrolase 1 n=1 Tax=Dispira parvispora TaxID=1520584 RepID=A0A9W8AN26_9FUNG|nr:hypothetical protein IWQ62_003837 [Dispira parvispora]
MADGSFPPSEPTDEQILHYEQEVKESHANQRPLVGEREALVELALEYQPDSPFRTQLEYLQTTTFGSVRRTRGDGNCFFRAFAFAWYEAVYTDAKRVRQALTALERCTTWLRDSGFDTLVYEDFLETCVNCLNTLYENSQELSPEDAQSLLENTFRNPEESNAIVVFLRFITSAYLQQHADDYVPFMEHDMDLKTFCVGFVEAMGVESDQIHIMALTRALQVDLRVAYVDGSAAQPQPVIHQFPSPDEHLSDEESTAISLLYRPGHYDILYPL